MNKKLFLLLFPILVLIVSINSRDNSSLSTNGLSSAVTYNNAYAIDLKADASLLSIPNSITKKHNGPNKNLIRIKAWDNVLSFDIPQTWVFTLHSDHTEKVLFITYSSYTLSNSRFPLPLRGPPQNTMA